MSHRRALTRFVLPVVALVIGMSVTGCGASPSEQDAKESARIDGAGELRIFTAIVLPLSRPALGVIGIFGFTMIWDQYLLPLLVAQASAQFTLPFALRNLRSDDQVGLGVLLAAALLALLPTVIAFLALQRQFMRGLTSGAIKG